MKKIYCLDNVSRVALIKQSQSFAILCMWNKQNTLKFEMQGGMQYLSSAGKITFNVWKEIRSVAYRIRMRLPLTRPARYDDGRHFYQLVEISSTSNCFLSISTNKFLQTGHCCPLGDFPVACWFITTRKMELLIFSRACRI